jgi:hypothetical protein
MKTINEAYKHLKEQKNIEQNYKKIILWWDNLPITKQQNLFWKYKGIKNINVKQFINDYDKFRIYNQVQELNN